MVGHGRGSHGASLRMWLIACFAKQPMSFIGQSTPGYRPLELGRGVDFLLA
jgi:hypothetical protein